MPPARPHLRAILARVGADFPTIREWSPSPASVGRGAALHPRRSERREKTAMSEPILTTAGRGAERVFFGWKVVAAAFAVAVFSWGIGF